ncbi:MAG: alpha/beta hydrolase [Candidatus Dormibacteraeota bacterium]|nr:alpha/beta hydrolase [Candidatus Dormibacteraeota bacterium]
MIATAIDGTRLHYRVAGSGPPIVLVGGKTSTIEGAWWRYVPVLAQELRVIALDNRGTGESDRPDIPYSTAMLADDALTVLRACGEDSAHWFGLSLGGMIVQQVALRHPAAVRSMILAATHCGGADGTGSSDEASLPRDNPLARYGKLYARSFLLEHPDWVAEDARHFGKMPLFAIHRQDQAVRNHRTCERLSEISAPALVIHGQQDRMVPVERARELGTGLANAELRVLDHAGHQVHSEKFEQVVTLVLAFVARVEEARRAAPKPPAR